MKEGSGIAFLRRLIKGFPVGEGRDDAFYGSLLDTHEKLGVRGHRVTIEAGFGAAMFVRVSGADGHILRSIRNLRI